MHRTGSLARPLNLNPQCLALSLGHTAQQPRLWAQAQPPTSLLAPPSHRLAPAWLASCLVLLHHPPRAPLPASRAHPDLSLASALALILRLLVLGLPRCAIHLVRVLKLQMPAAGRQRRWPSISLASCLLRRTPPVISTTLLTPLIFCNHANNSYIYQKKSLVNGLAPSPPPWDRPPSQALADWIQRTLPPERWPPPRRCRTASGWP